MQNEFSSEEKRDNLIWYASSTLLEKTSFSLSLYSTIFWAIKEMATGLSSEADGKQ